MTDPQDTHHDKTRAYPSGDESILRSVIDRVGLPVIGYEFKVLDDSGAYWFDVAVMHNGEISFIDLHDQRHPETEQAKITWCQENNVPLLLLPMGKTTEWEARVEIWLLTKNT